MNLEIETLETVLRNDIGCSKVERVLSVELERGLQEGENFCSMTYRIKIVAVLQNGRKARRSFFLKTIPNGVSTVKFAEEFGVFRKETKVYAIIFSEIDALMNEFGDTSEKFWCDLIDYEPYRSLLLEDLKASGYRNAKRQDSLDMEHSMGVLTALGRFHALTRVLETRGIHIKDNVNSQFIYVDDTSVKRFAYYPLQLLCSAMERNWGAEWKELAKKMKKVPLDVFTECSKYYKEPKDSIFTCLNHGDCWSNNIMFKYDWKNRPLSVKLVDFQCVHYNSPAFDVAHMLYSSVLPDVRRSNYYRLLDCYLDSLNGTLDTYGYLGLRLDRESLKEALDGVILVRIFSLTFPFAVATSTKAGVLNFDKIIHTNGKEGLDISIYDEAYQRKVGPDLIKLAGQLQELNNKYEAGKNK